MTEIKNLKAWRIALIASSLLLVFQLFTFLVHKASAGTLTNTFVRFDRMQTSTATTGTICAKPASAGTVAQVSVSFPTGYTVSTTAANWAVSTVTTTGWPAGSSAWPGITVPGSAPVGQVVIFPSSTLTVGTLYCFNWTNTAALTTSASATNSNTGTITTQTSVPATIDTGTFSTATVSSDQVTVTASINPSFSMSFAGGTTDALGTLTTAAVASSSTVTFTVNTNAKNGWMAWVKDANTGLNSSSASYTIPSTNSPGLGSASAALVAGTEGYNVGIAYAQTSGSCTAGSAVNANFDKAGASNKGGSFDPTLRTILTCGGTTNTGVVTPTNFAAINGATAAATDYTDTQTYVAAGIF